MHDTAPIVVDPRLLEKSFAVTEPEVPGAQVHRRGKVRTVFHAGPEHFVIVASDRLSAYDVVLPTPIPGKGAILSLISAFWMKSLRAATPHHLVSDDRPRSRRRSASTRRASRGGRSSCAARNASTSSAWCAAT
jgi:hypothetical protein